MELSQDFFAAAYLVATIFFIFGLKGLASPKTAFYGNVSAIVGTDWSRMGQEGSSGSMSAA